jgi:tryptophan halogenase
MNLNDHIDNVFDLSYLDHSEFSATTIRSIGIVGGGTAGYLTALALNKCHPEIKVTLIESSKIPIIGVGESTTTEIVPFLHRLLEIDPVEFFKEVEPTIKLGIRFDWGMPGDYKFNFSFYAGHQYESYFYENSIANCNWTSVLMNENKLPILRQENGQLLSFLNTIPFSYHLDNKKLVRFLKKEIQKRGMQIRDAEVDRVQLDEDGFVNSLHFKEGGSANFDLYIDCSGFRSKLLGQTLKTEFISFKDTLITDRALAFELDNKNVLDCYTAAITMDNGWCWKIPVQNEDHLGSVFSTKFCDDETALAEVRKKFGEPKGYRYVDFRSGRHAKAWNKNVFALGNAYAFLEPLESTGIQMLVHSVMLLNRIMPHSLNDESSIAGLNHEIAATWDTFRWFLGVHYKFNQKLKTPFWDWCRKNTNIGDAEHILRLFHEKAPLSKGKFGTSSGYTAFEPLVFNSYSYDSLLFGQKVLDHQKMIKPAMSKAKYEEKINSYQQLAKVSMTQFDFFNHDKSALQEMIMNLFQDEDTWIAETSV